MRLLSERTLSVDRTKRINADEILRQMGGDWHKDSDNLKAMREEIK